MKTLLNVICLFYLDFALLSKLAQADIQLWPVLRTYLGVENCILTGIIFVIFLSPSRQVQG
jgi:hypothetical protein